MKKNIFALAAIVIAMVIAPNVQAQTSDTEAAPNTNRDYTRVSVGFNFGTSNPLPLVSIFAGGTAEVIHGFNITGHAHPLYLETGLTYAGESGGEPFNETNVDYNYQSLSVPVNLTWRIKCGENFRISPIVGLYGKVNIVGKKTGKYKDGTLKYSHNMFDKNDVGDQAWKHFQPGVNMGVNFDIHHVTIGVAYTFDLTNCSATQGDVNDRWGFCNFKVGYNF